MVAHNEISGGVTAPQGFKAAAVYAGIKGKKLDMALLVSDRPATMAGVFTQNRIKGNTVKLCRESLAAAPAGRALVVNSGNANACNGAQGLADARRMAEVTASLLGVDAREVYVCSTGTIGLTMPMDKIEAGIRQLVPALAADGGPQAARAIMTTDTVDKQVTLEFSVDGHRVRLGGMAKGAGMIEPNMATMLSFLTTDAAVDRAALQAALAEAVEASFNKISVDGDQSCNDTVLIFANGAAGNRPLRPGHPDWPAFEAALREATLRLAQKIVRDGEGATKFVTLRVRGAATAADARLAVRAVGRSFLVKTSWFGGDPNWGRIIDAVGYSGAAIEEEKTDIFFGDFCAVRGGQAVAGVLPRLEKVLAGNEFSIIMDLHLGTAEDVLYTCDCSEQYVRINAEYMT